MASPITFTPTIPTPVRAASSRNPEPNRRKPASSTWWAPLFGISSDPDYLERSDKPLESQGFISDSETGRFRSRFHPGCFTEEKAKELRRKTAEGSAFHDIMYHSAIASRLASDVSGRVEK